MICSPVSALALRAPGTDWAAILNDGAVIYYEGTDLASDGDSWVSIQPTGPTRTLGLIGGSGGGTTKETWQDDWAALSTDGRLQAADLSIDLPNGEMTWLLTGTFPESFADNTGMMTIGGESFKAYNGYCTSGTLYMGPIGGEPVAGLSLEDFEGLPYIYIARFKQGAYRHVIHCDGETRAASSTSTTAPQSSYGGISIGGFFNSGGTFGGLFGNGRAYADVLNDAALDLRILAARNYYGVA